MNYSFLKVDNFGKFWKFCAGFAKFLQYKFWLDSARAQPLVPGFLCSTGFPARRAGARRGAADAAAAAAAAAGGPMAVSSKKKGEGPGVVYG